MKAKAIVLAALYIFVSLFAQGCWVAVAGAGVAGTVVYLKGDVERIEQENIDVVYTAAQKAVDELGLTPIRSSKDALSAEIIARDAQDKKVTIKLKRREDNSTKISIRVGVVGDKTKARLIYQEIINNLR